MRPVRYYLLHFFKRRDSCFGFVSSYLLIDDAMGFEKKGQMIFLSSCAFARMVLFYRHVPTSVG